jgi:type VI secretion system protein ImpJ
MKPAKPLFWHQGLFLQPQHFQQLDLYTSSLNVPLQTYGMPWFWGVIAIAVNDDHLKNDTVSLYSCELLFPDGTWVSSAENATLLSRVIDKKNFEPHKPFLVYAAIHRHSSSQPNVEQHTGSEELIQSATRFTVDTGTTECADIHESAEPGNVSRLKYIVKLFFEYEKDLLGDYTFLPVARMEYDGEKFIRYSDFAPPVPVLHLSPVLSRCAKSIADQMLGVSRRLEQYKVPRESITAQNSPAYSIFMLGLLVVNRYTPLLFHCLSSPACHPYYFFGILRQIIGELSSFTDRHGCLADLPDGTRLCSDYDHQDINRSFNQASELISALLRSLLAGPENTITFNRDPDGGFSAVIPLNTFENTSHFFLLFHTLERLERILSSVNDSIKIGSRHSIGPLISRALPGLPLEYIQIPPPGIPRRNDSHCFKIDLYHEQWNEIQKDRSMCIYWDQAPQDISFELIILRS